MPAAIHEKITAIQVEVRKRGGGDSVKWVPFPELALVLVPLGEIRPGTIASIRLALEQVCARHAPVDLALAGIGGSPNMVQPKEVWIGVQAGDEARLRSLVADLEKAVQGLSALPTHPPFEARLDIGRLKVQDDQARTGLGRALRLVQVGELLRGRMNDVQILRSTAGTMGPHLEIEARIPLRGIA